MKQNSKLMLTMSEQVRSFWISLALLFVLTVPGSNSASAQTTQTPQAYITWWCYCPGPACDAFCPNLNAASVVSSLAQTDGPSDFAPTWSADGTQIAFTRSSDIFLLTTLVSITNTANNWAPAWSPDGARIAFVSTRDASHGELYLMDPDGSNVVRLTYNIGFSVGHPAWSRDGARIAFNCQVQSGNDDICAINRDGTGFARLTTDPASDSGPTWSPDGAEIAFAGSGQDSYGNYVPAIYTMQADGTAVTFFVNSASEPAWMPAKVPIATFKASCNGTTCSFDASGSKDSYGTITSYAWNFGDGVTGAGASLAHTYAGGGNYTVRLTVTDSNSATGTKIQTITINPVASFTFSCNGLTCNFDGSGSKDPYGTITSYADIFLATRAARPKGEWL